MDTRALSVFLSVAETLNFSRTSEILHMSVSAVSRSIGRLEAELGHALLERDTRRVRLTAAGKEFREYARRAVADWQQLRRTLGSSDQLAGEVSVYCSVTASHSILAPVLESFRAAHPAIDIMLHTGDQADGVRRVLDGQDDIAVSGRPADLPHALEFLTLLTSPLLLCAPRADCAVREVLSPANGSAVDWERVPFIVPERGVTKELLQSWFTQRQIRPRIYAQVAGHEAIVAMVGLGLGVGVAPQLVIEASGLAERVTTVAVEDALPPLVIGLCSTRRRLSSPHVEAFWQVAEQTYRRAL